jgi:pimeloyl-ACP methyl ester carboxylesterase
VDPQSRDIVFRAYYTPSTLTDNPEEHTGKRQRGSVLVCHHGGGSAGTTFACLAKRVHELSGGELGVLAFDARGHGKIYFNQLAIHGLTDDITALLGAYRQNENGARGSRTGSLV